MKWSVVLKREAEGGYSVSCPALPGCHSQGETRAEALANIKDAIELCVAARNDRAKAAASRGERLAKVEV